ncbi:conserved exported hypothetical protein [Candidatus Desulfarcum epimagneticum]|uniref:Secretin/TonB short N-terminal domain-containing protein n=1 Tax=uncultured Desulfobacteraceae bacterium TaxID=218296 RepID=A0A484HIK8_9BACT|nr:conserved exported hypothetical protein [uncultured Desulfobacteraceae bacterium]
MTYETFKPKTWRFLWILALAAAFFSARPALAVEKTPDQVPRKKISVFFYDADIKNVFHTIREVSGENIVIDPDVKGKATLSISKPAPWDQVLDVVLKMNRLGQTRRGNIIRIATLGALERERKLAAAAPAAEQEKTEPAETEYIPVNYADAKKDIVPHIEPVLSPGGRVGVDERSNTLIVSDSPTHLRRVAEIVRRMDQPPPQVMIEARIVEAAASFSREIGVDWGMSAEVRNGIGGSDFGGTYGFNAAVNLPGRAAEIASAGVNFMKISGTPFLLNAKLAAMESFGKGKIVSAPKIITLSAQKAIIRQGVAYPYHKTDDAGNTTTEFKNIDLVLEVTPHVNPDSRILLDIDIKKNDIDVNTIINNQPSFTTKEAMTRLLVDDRETVVIGGIIKTRKSGGEVGVPFLSRLPGIGALFRSRNRIREKEELLIFITPKIIRLPQRRASSP